VPVRHLDVFPINPGREPEAELDLTEPADLVNLATLDVSDDARHILLDLFQGMEVAAAREWDQHRATLTEHKRRAVERLARHLAAGGQHRAVGGVVEVAAIDMVNEGRGWWRQRAAFGQRPPVRLRVRWASQHGTSGQERRVHEGEVVLLRHERTVPRWAATAAATVGAVMVAVCTVAAVTWLVGHWQQVVAGVVVAVVALAVAAGHLTAAGRGE
jgi:hypothetical protein